MKRPLSPEAEAEGDDAPVVRRQRQIGARLDTEDVSDYLEGYVASEECGVVVFSCFWMATWLIPAYVQARPSDDLSARVFREGLVGPEKELHVDRVCERASYREARLLVIPMIIREHYVLWVVSRANRRIEHYDSLSSAVISDREISACLVALDWFATQLGWWAKGSDGLRHTLMLPSPPHQTTTVDCGVFVCMYAYLRIIGGLAPREIEKHPLAQRVDNFRAYITGLLTPDDDPPSGI